MPNQHTVKKLPLPPGKKMCNTCRKILPVEDFYRQYGKHASGKPRTDYKPDCKICSRKKNHEYQKIRRENQKRTKNG